VYAHIYYEHFDQICALGIEGTSMRPEFEVWCGFLLLPISFHSALLLIDAIGVGAGVGKLTSISICVAAVWVISAFKYELPTLLFVRHRGESCLH
jgi:hypothetical protein